MQLYKEWAGQIYKKNDKYNFFLNPIEDCCIYYTEYS